MGLAGLAIALPILDAHVKSALYYFASTGESPAQFGTQLVLQVCAKNNPATIWDDKPITYVTNSG